MSKRWYVVHAFSGYEKQVGNKLRELIERESLEEFFGQILVPVEEVVEVKNGKRVRSERKFFPGYVLVEMELTDKTWHLVRSVPNVMGFIGGSNDKPAPISKKEVDRIMDRMQEGTENPRPKIMFEAGEMVRVTDGPFADFEAVVEDVDYEKNKLQVSVLIFGRSTNVEVEFGQVEKS